MFLLEKARDADEKFNKLKVMYGKLRQDHIDLLRKVCLIFTLFTEQSFKCVILISKNI